MSEFEYPFGNDRERQEFFVSRYLDGDLSPEERAEVERLIESDAELAALLASFQRVDDLVSAGSGDLPELDWERFELEASDRRGLETVPATQRTWRFAMPFAAAAAIVLATLLYVRMESNPVGQTASRDDVSEVTPDASGIVVAEANQRYGVREVEETVARRFQLTIHRAPEITSPRPSSMLIAYAGDTMDSRIVQEMPLF